MFRLILVASIVAVSSLNARAITLDALCASNEVTRSVLQFSKGLRFPADAQKMKPDTAYFIEEVGPMSCTYYLTAGNAYDFGIFKATFTSPAYGQLKVNSLTPVD